MGAALEELRQRISPVPVGPAVLPVAAALAGLLPYGGLSPGSTVAVAGSPSLALALVAEVSAAGSWCAAVGLPSLGLAAAAEAGVALERLALVPDPGPDWLRVAAALVDGFAVVLVSLPRRVPAADARRLAARARERGSVLVVLEEAGAKKDLRWEGAQVRLSVAAARWEGLDSGNGYLRARWLRVRAEGRGAATRPRSLPLWLPPPGGGVAPAAQEHWITRAGDGAGDMAGVG